MKKYKFPERYHKHFNKHKYFEGWYYKQVSADSLHTLSIIPGVSYNTSESHCFIQCLHYNKETGLDAYNIDFPIATFQPHDSPFEIVIEKNRFRFHELTLHIDTPDLKIHGTLHFQDITPIQTSILHPNIMGIFSYIPNMECNHAVLSMNHSLLGGLTINGTYVDFSGGKGYIEKDWGRSFPSNYVWIQSNHFTNTSVSLFCSIAKIPFGLFYFTGFICNFLYHGTEYRFASYNHSKLNILNLTEKTFHLQLKNKHYTLFLEGSTEFSKDLLAPKLGAMNTTIKEGLSGKVHVILQKNSGEKIFHASSSQCGIELEYHT